MVTAVSAQPEEPIVSMGSVPRGSCAHTGERWVNTGTALVPASAGTDPPAPAATASRLHAARTNALLTAPSYGVRGPKSSGAAGRFGPLRDRHRPAGPVPRLAGQQALEVAGMAGQGQPDIEDVIDADGRVVGEGLIEDGYGLPHPGRRLDHHQPTGLALATSDADHGLVVGGRDQVKLTVGQALAAARTLIPGGLAAQDFQKIHGLIHTPIARTPKRPPDSRLRSLWGHAGGLLPPAKVAILGRDEGPAGALRNRGRRPARRRSALHPVERAHGRGAGGGARRPACSAAGRRGGVAYPPSACGPQPAAGGPGLAYPSRWPHGVDPDGGRAGPLPRPGPARPAGPGYQPPAADRDRLQAYRSGVPGRRAAASQRRDALWAARHPDGAHHSDADPLLASDFRSGVGAGARAGD